MDLRHFFDEVAGCHKSTGAGRDTGSPQAGWTHGVSQDGDAEAGARTLAVDILAVGSSVLLRRG